jgi:Spy/CpxP family protein refolding chaperone
MLKSMQIFSQSIFALTFLSLTVLPVTAWSQSDDDMDSMHRGMQNSDYDSMYMPRMGRGMGMMGNGMMGYGGMGMMGNGMMGYGGMGMMGNGMMGYGGMGMMDLDKNQRAKIRSIMREQRENRCKMMTSMMDVGDELAEQYDKNEPDAKAIGKIYARMFEQRRKMIEQSVETRNRIRNVLSDEQKKQFDNMRHGRGMMGPGARGMMNGGMGMMGRGHMGMMNGGKGMME